MAAISKRPNGRYWVQFTAPNKKRLTMRLGQVSKSEALQFKQNIERLLLHHELNAPLDAGTLRWLGNLSLRHNKQLAQYGLVRARMSTLAELLDWFTDQLKKRKSAPSTLENFRVVAMNLQAKFGADRLLRAFHANDASAFAEYLEGSARVSNGTGLAPATVSRRCRRAKEIFAQAVDQGWLAENPFQKIPSRGEINEANEYFVPRDIANDLIEAAGDLRFRLILALVRYAGLRCPSEIRPLQWSWVDWENQTLRVYAPKTARYPKGSWRVLPLYPEVITRLNAVWDTVGAGDGDAMFPILPNSGTALRNRLEKICHRVGVEFWPRPFDNLRASCENDWLEEYPIHRVAAWMGHSPKVALEHYNLVAKEQVARKASADQKGVYKSDVKSDVGFRSAGVREGSESPSGNHKTP